MNWRKTTILNVILNVRQTGIFALSIIGAFSLWGGVWHHPSLLAFAPDLGEETRMSVESLKKSYLSNHPLIYESCTNNSIVPKHWCLDDQKIPRYVGKEAWPPRIIQHYTHEGYEKCLADKTVVFIGDSRVRYQFLNLADLLISKRFMKCQDYRNYVASEDNQNVVLDPECYLIQNDNTKVLAIKDWGSWYKQSTLMLESNTSSADHNKQSSLCDCFRPLQFKERSTFENRYIKRSTPFGEVNLIYLQNFVNKIRLSKDFPPFSPYFSTSNRCKTGECSHVNEIKAFQGDTNSTLWNIVPRLNATHVFVNLGWDMRGWDMNYLSEFSCLIRDFERQYPHIKVFFISHPANPDGPFDPAQFKCDTNVLDRDIISKGVPKEWYWDRIHVLSILNEEFNHQMVESICPIK